MNLRDILQGRLLLGSWLHSNILLCLWIVFLSLLYITNRYGIETTVKDIESCSKEIKNLNLEHVEMKKKYQQATMMRVVAEKLSPIGVDISKEPIKEVIFISPMLNSALCWLRNGSMNFIFANISRWWLSAIEFSIEKGYFMLK